MVARTTAASSVAVPAARIAEVDATAAAYVPTGVDELDRVLGGGMVPGAVVLLTGEPGVGKSTLLIDVAARYARSQGTAPRPSGGAPGTVPGTVLYVTGEESAAQVKLRAERVGAIADTLYLCAESDLGTVLGQIEQLKPSLLVMDSVQTLSSAEVDGAAGGVTQVREVAASLIAVAKRLQMTTLLVGHVTKDGSIAGPRLLEHLVDVVCQFEGERHSRLRLLRAVKNRYGPTEEVGCFDLHENGIQGLIDPSGLFVSGTKEPVSGTCITVALEGRRPLLTEVQSLLAPSSTAQPRRATSGLDSARVSMLLAVLQQRVGAGLDSEDCYVATVGGVRLSEPATDLAIALSLASAKCGRALPSRLVAFGEVGLAGEVRPVPGINQRIQEAHRLGFNHAVVPVSAQGPGSIPEGLRVHQVHQLSEALDLLLPSPTDS